MGAEKQDHSHASPPPPQLQALLPPHLSLHGAPLPCASRRSLGPVQPCCLPRKLCCSGASGRRPATPTSTSPTSPVAGVTGWDSAPSSTPTGVCEEEGPSALAALTWPETGLSLLPGGFHPPSQLHQAQVLNLPILPCPSGPCNLDTEVERAACQGPGLGLPSVPLLGNFMELARVAFEPFLSPLCVPGSILSPPLGQTCPFEALPSQEPGH